MRLANFFSSVDKRVLVMIGGGALLLSLLISGILFVRDLRMDRVIDREEQAKMAYDASRLSTTTADRNRRELLYPEVIEELDLANDPYREEGFAWDEKEVSRLWIEPDAADIEYFSEANHKLIWEILKDAP